MPPIKGRRAKAADTNAKGHRSNTLGLGEQQTAAVLDKLDGKNAGKSAVQRTFTRMQFRVPSLSLNLVHPGGSYTSVQVVCRNISRGGIGVLHSAFAHTDTRCTVDMPRLDGSVDHIEGIIVRCTHVAGQIHELGILFDEEVSVTNYLEIDPAEGVSTFERVDPETLEGTAVALIANEIEGRMLGHFLTDSNMKLRITSDPAEGAAFLADGCDIAIVDISVPCAEEMVFAARQVSAGMPIVAVMADSSRESRVLAETLGVSGSLIKPLSSERLLSTLAECLLAPDATALASGASSALSPELLAACIDQLHSITDQLRNAAEGEDAMRVYALCQQIKATCSPIGMHEIDGAAEQASAAISESMSIAESQRVVQDLLRLCDRVKKPAA